MKAPTYSSEAALCADFIGALGDGWVAYPETADFDIVLVRKEDGFQIGVEAKLRLNPIVLSQITEGRWDWYRSGPDCRAVLVPEGAVVAGVGTLAERLAVTVVAMRPTRQWGMNARFHPSLPTVADRYRGADEEWHELCPVVRLTLPQYVPDTAAGSSAPLKLTDWKIRAIKVAVLLDTNGTVSRADFKHIGIDIRRWIDGDWLKAGPNGFVRGDHCPEFKAQHPRNYGEIAADFLTWAPKQEALL